VTAPLHPQLLSAFLDGKSCATIARTFSLSIEEVLAWFESDLTQSTLRRLESLQLQQARIVSFSVLPGAADSLTNTCHTADNPILRTRAASNLVRLGLRFAAPSKSPSLAQAVADAASDQPAAEIATPAERPNSTIQSRSSEPFVPSDPSVNSDSSAAKQHTDLICESLRAEFAALRTESRNSLSSSSRIRASESRKAIHRSQSAPRLEPAHNHQTVALESAPTLDPPPTFVTPLLSRRESGIASLRSSAGATASRDPFPALNRAPPRNSHAPPPMNTAA
jgi:hypothetical protein